MSSERIGFFGGSFNPPTNIHINLANMLIEQNKVDKVVFVPVGNYYPKKDLAEASDRYNMLKLACKDYKKLEVEDLASSHPNNLFASDTFKLIYEKYANNDIFFIMGSDNFEKMPTWKNYEYLKNNYKFIVLERNKTEISSSQIRKMIRNHQDVEEWINKDVWQYIIQKKLYNYSN